MRYGIVSDVHGNIEALEAVMDHLAGENIDAYAFLGDAVGYGPDPDAVCTLLREKVSFAVVGNHDAAVAGRMDFSGYYDAARHAIVWCQKELSSDNMEWLRTLPYTQQDGHVGFCHGAPLAPELFDYLMLAEEVMEMEDGVDDLNSVTFIGHSHLTLAFEIDDTRVTPLNQTVIECDPQAKYIITAGSVGQPRDRNPDACCGIYDSDERRFVFRRVDYDRRLTRQKILEAGLAALFGDRLLVGV